MSEFVALPTLAIVAGISRQALEKTFGKIVRGEAEFWRGAAIQVRHVRGRGGRSGLRYEVRIGSLPTDLQQRLKDHLTPAALPVLAYPNGQRAGERNWWLRVLGPLLAMPPGRARAAVIDALAARQDLTDWRGRPITLSPRTIHRRLKAYRDNGAFAPRARADKGHAKVLISLAAERAIPFDDQTWERIAIDLRSYVRGHWKKGATLKLIRAHANFRFRLVT
jgi:hypothetical protein